MLGAGVLQALPFCILGSIGHILLPHSLQPTFKSLLQLHLFMLPFLKVVPELNFWDFFPNISVSISFPHNFFTYLTSPFPSPTYKIRPILGGFQCSLSLQADVVISVFSLSMLIFKALLLPRFFFFFIFFSLKVDLSGMKNK